MHRLHEVVTDPYIVRQQYLDRQGYIFTRLKSPNVYDAIVIRNPSRCWSGNAHYGFSGHTLEDHIALIHQYQIEKAIIIAEDIGFLPQCTSLKYIQIIPANTALDGFDYTPLYEMPCLKYLTCETAYGGPADPLSAVVDYARISGLTEINVIGKGHQNYHRVDTLEQIFLSGNRTHEDMTDLSCSPVLKKIWCIQCNKMKSLQGIGQFRNLQFLSLDYMRTLQDISPLSGVADCLRLLSIHNCPKITDFSVLHRLVNLEHLELYGKNQLPDLAFLHNMKKLKTFTFSMEVQNGDLTPCLQVPYAWVSRNKRAYNLKDRDLPKNGPDAPFTLL